MITDLNLVRAFVAAAERGSFSAAAPLLHRTQAAVSQQIRRLEEELGDSLFSRDSRAVTLSPAGQRFLPYARRLLSLSDEAGLTVGGMQVRRLLRIGAADDLVAHVLMPALAQLQHHHADLRFEIVTGSTRELLSMLEARLDIVVGLAHPSPHRESPLSILNLGWFGAWSGSGGVPLALCAEGCQIRALVIAALDRAGIPWEIKVSASSTAAVEAAARSGLAVGVLAKAIAPPGLPVLKGLPELQPLQARLFTTTRADSELVAEIRTLLSRAFRARPAAGLGATTTRLGKPGRVATARKKRR